MAYSDKVIDHFENPKNVGSFNKDEEGIGTGIVGAPACGDVMKLQLKINNNGIIEDAIYNEISEIDKKSSPIFLQIEIEDNCIFKGI